MKYRIVSVPKYIEFECKWCGEDIRIDLDDENELRDKALDIFNAPFDVTCPDCCRVNLLTEWEYD